MEKTCEARESLGLFTLADYNLLPLYLAAYQAGVPVDITGGDQVFEGITIEGLRREIEWRTKC